MGLEQIDLPKAKRALRFELWRKGVRVKGVNPKDCVESLDAQAQLADYGNQLAVTAAMSILTENVAEVRAPKDWWEALKERWFPKWLLRLFPVRWSFVDVRALYPDPEDLKTRVLIAKPTEICRSFYENVAKWKRG